MKTAMMLLSAFTISFGESCSHGPQIDATCVDNIVIGETIRSEIEQWFGSPTMRGNVTDGKTGSVLIYTYQWRKGSQLTGTLASKTLVVWFDKQDVVVDMKFTDWQK